MLSPSAEGSSQTRELTNGFPSQSCVTNACAANDRSLTRVDWYVMVGTMVMVAAAFTYRIATTGLLCDELLFIHAIDMGLPNSVLEPGSSHPPLMRFVIGLFANSSSPDWALRLPSVIISLLTVIVWGHLLRRLIDDQTVRALILPAMALNPIWLHHGYQCLPYAGLALFGSLHALAFLRYVEQPNRGRGVAFVLSGIPLPWTHFLGVCILIADQFVWLFLLLTKQTSLKKHFMLNLSIAAFTLPVAPIAAFYLWHDRAYPLLEIKDHWTYFTSASAVHFSLVTFPRIETIWPVYLLLYGGAFAIFVKAFKASLQTNDSTSTTKTELNQFTPAVIVSGFLLGGFAASQTVSLLVHTAMWPRFMLAGAWVHLPLMAVILLAFTPRRVAIGASAVVLASGVIGFISIVTPSKATQYEPIAQHMESCWQDDDVFLAQSVDFWQGDNQFDRLWFRRYVDSNRPIVTAPHEFRHDIKNNGIHAPIAPGAKRMWVYSHLFRNKWLEHHDIPGWKVAEVSNFDDEYPLILFERIATEPSPAATADAETVALKRSH